MPTDKEFDEICLRNPPSGYLSNDNPPRYAFKLDLLLQMEDIKRQNTFETVLSCLRQLFYKQLFTEACMTHNMDHMNRTILYRRPEFGEL